MVGAKKKKKPALNLPQFKIGEIYHADIHGGYDRKGHFVVVAAILSPTEVKVHVCTSSETSARYGSIPLNGFLGDGMTYIMLRPEIINPSAIGASRHLSIPRDVADRLGIRLP